MQQDNRAGTRSVRPRSSIARRLESWRTPAVILICGCLISMIGFGPRATLGFFLTPMSTAMAGDARCLRSRSRSRRCSTARPSRSRAPSPTASAQCA